MTVFLALLLGLVLGAILGWSVARRDETMREVAQQSHSVRQLVEPLREQLGRVEGQLRGLETERARAFGELSRQVDTVRQSSELLGRETASLVNALRKP